MLLELKKKINYGYLISEKYEFPGETHTILIKLWGCQILFLTAM